MGSHHLDWAALQESKLNPTEKNLAKADRAKNHFAQLSLEAEINYIEPSKNIKDFSRKPSRELRSLFIDLAKNIHPDLASSEVEKVWRDKFMREANIAYMQLDELKLQIIYLQVIKQKQIRDFN